MAKRPKYQPRVGESIIRNRGEWIAEAGHSISTFDRLIPGQLDFVEGEIAVIEKAIAVIRRNIKHLRKV